MQASTSGPAHNPAVAYGGSGKEHPFKAVWGAFTKEERAAGLIEDGMFRLEVGASTLTVAPKVEDKVRVQDRIYNVSEVEIIRPGGVPLLYRLRVEA